MLSKLFDRWRFGRKKKTPPTKQYRESQTQTLTRSEGRAKSAIINHTFSGQSSGKTRPPLPRQFAQLTKHNPADSGQCTCCTCEEVDSGASLSSASMTLPNYRGNLAARAPPTPSRPPPTASANNVHSLEISYIDDDDIDANCSSCNYNYKPRTINTISKLNQAAVKTKNSSHLIAATPAATTTCCCCCAPTTLVHCTPTRCLDSVCLDGICDQFDPNCEQCMAAVLCPCNRPQAVYQCPNVQYVHKTCAPSPKLVRRTTSRHLVAVPVVESPSIGYSDSAISCEDIYVASTQWPQVEFDRKARMNGSLRVKTNRARSYSRPPPARNRVHSSMSDYADALVPRPQKPQENKFAIRPTADKRANTLPTTSTATVATSRPATANTLNVEIEIDSTMHGSPSPATSASSTTTAKPGVSDLKQTLPYPNRSTTTVRTTMTLPTFSRPPLNKVTHGYTPTTTTAATTTSARGTSDNSQEIMNRLASVRNRVAAARAAFFDQKLRPTTPTTR